MKHLAIIIAAAGMTALLGGPAAAGSYPIHPPGTSVTLQPADFIQSVPSYSSINDVNPGAAIGDNLGQHPGAFRSGMPPLNAFFIGVFGGPIDITRPDAAVYLWETSGGPLNGDTGPQITLGYWDGNAFTPYGNGVAASYFDTGVTGLPSGLEINSSITPLSAFSIPGNPILNAVEIKVVDVAAHNQVTAVAVHTVPEPTSTLLLGTGLAGLLGCIWRGKKGYA